MLLGVVSDTHNRISNVEKIVEIFNSNKVDLVIHTGDITQAKILDIFCGLKSSLLGVFGNNDLNEPGLEESVKRNGFKFSLPPLITSISGKKIAILHEPDEIENIIKREKNLDLILHGHTHRYRDEIVEGVKIFNPGECAGSINGKNAVGLITLNNLETERIFF